MAQSLAPRGKGVVLLAAGGTGGHMFPAEALAAALIEHGLGVVLVTDRRGTDFSQRLPQVTTCRISAGGMTGVGLVQRAQGAASLALGFIQARRLIARVKPRIAVGFGGYASVPSILAAAQVAIPIVLHEQNAVVGRANRMLARHAAAIATSFPNLAGFPEAPAARLVLTGNPVRPAIAALAGHAYAPIVSDGPIRLLILGGSQGARVFAHTVPAAIARLPVSLRRRVVITQQCRPEDIDQVRSAISELGVAGELSTFFEDVPERLAAAHLVICRAGASTIAELTTLGRPALLVPYPYAADDHQTANARSISEAGGAWAMPEPTFGPETLADRLLSLLAQPAALARAARCAQAIGVSDAANRLSALVLSLVPSNGWPSEAAHEIADREAAA